MNIANFCTKIKHQLDLASAFHGIEAIRLFQLKNVYLNYIFYLIKKQSQQAKTHLGFNAY